MTDKSKKTQPKDTSSSEKTAAKHTEKKTESESKQREIAIPRKYLIGGALVIAGLALAGFLFSKWYTVAKVNGETISRAEYTSELEKAAGKQVLDSLTTKKIITQEAKNKNISVSSQEIDNEIKKIEAQLKTQGQSLDQVLAFQGQTRDSLREQIVLQKTVEKMVGKVTVTDAEVDKFIEENQDLAGQDTDLNTLKTQAKERLTQQKTDSKIQALIQDLRKKAKIEVYND